MSEKFDAPPPIESIDIGGVEVAELLSKSATKNVALSRRNFLTLGAAAVGTAVGASVLLTATPAHADILDTLNKFLDLDPIVLNYAHEMEELQKDFFLRAVNSNVYQMMEARERSSINLIAVQDSAHFNALDRLRSRIGAKAGGHFETRNTSASARPRIFNFPRDTFRSREKFFPLAVEIKESCVAAYHGAVDLLFGDELLPPAVAIAGVDGRHLVILREMAGLDPVPTPFENQISPQTIGNRLARYGFQGGANRGGVQ